MENKKENNILKCFVSVTGGDYTSTQEQKDIAIEQGRLFRSYIWGEESLSKKLERLNYEDYGKDLILVLFQFYVNPILLEMESLSEIEKYRKKEKAIGIPIIINEGNFFSKSERDRYEFLKQSIISKMDVLAEVVREKKLDTNVDLLKSDLAIIL